MDKSKNIINYYLYINKLKYKLRTGFIEIGITKDRLESVAEHIYGCLMLSIAIDSEYHLDIDMYKVLKMLTIHELDEVLKPDFTIRSGITKEKKENIGKESVDVVADCLSSKDEIISLINEFNERKTKEANFCYLIDKLECDMLDKEATCASDYWILYDRPKFEENEIFRNLSHELSKIKELK